jgi:hypothetical protein
MFEHVRAQWPGATVQGSTLEDYLNEVLEAVAAGGVTLPVVTGGCNGTAGRGREGGEGGGGVVSNSTGQYT